MVKQSNPLPRLLTRRRQSVALRRRVTKNIIRPFQPAQTSIVRLHLRKNRERHIPILPLRRPHEVKIIHRQPRASQQQIRARHLPRIEPRPRRIAAIRAAVRRNLKMTGVRRLDRRRQNVLLNRRLDARANLRILDLARPSHLSIPRLACDSEPATRPTRRAQVRADSTASKIAAANEIRRSMLRIR